MKRAQATHPKTQARVARHARIRAKISGTAERPRLSVFRSNTAIHAQLIDDTSSTTLAAISDTQMKGDGTEGRSGKVAKAYQAGREIAARAQALNVSHIVFDRGGYAYHGRVRAFAEGARDGGLIF